MVQFPGSQFVGGAYANGFGIHFTRLTDGSAVASYAFDPLKQGPPGYAHGGAIAAVLDEAMTAVVYWGNRAAFTVNLSVDYRLPVPLNETVVIRASITHQERRKIFLRASIELSDGSIAAEAKALFLTANKTEF